jgi:hypothetical protein
VEQLPPAELAKFREWFAKYDAAQWDRAIEDDVRSGRLDALADEAIADWRLVTVSTRSSLLLN